METAPAARLGRSARKSRPGRGLFRLRLLVLGAGVLVGGPRDPAADYVYLGRSITLSQRARQLRSIGSLPADWTSPLFDDSAWTSPPVVTQPPTNPPPAIAGSLWQTAPPPSASPAPVPPPEPVLIFTEDLAPLNLPPPPPPPSAARLPSAGPPAPTPPSPGFATLGGFLAAASSALVAPGGPALAAAFVPVHGGGPGMAADAPIFPPCSGTLYVRRHFSLGPEAAQLSNLTLRMKYTDAFVAYLNGVEVARRRLSEQTPTGPTTLANDRGPVEPESFYLSVTPGQLQPHDNVLALELHAKAVDRCAKADLELLGTTGPKVVRGPYIERLADGTLDVTLATDQPAVVELRYGKGEARTAGDHVLAVSPTPQTLHRARVTGLRAGRVYHYQPVLVGPGDTRSELPVVAVHTPPPAGRPLRVVLYGDSRSGHNIHSQIISAILEEDPDLVLHTGDVVERGTEEGDWDRFFAVAAPLLSRVPVYLTPGNHEYARRRLGAQRLFTLFANMFPAQDPLAPTRPQPKRAGLPAPAGGALPSHLLADAAATAPMQPLLPDSNYEAASEPAPNNEAPPRPPANALLPPPPPPSPVASELPGEGLRGFYSLDVSGVHLVSIDSNQIRRREQLRWLGADLQAAETRGARATLVWMHDGPFSTGYHGGNASARDLVPLFLRYHVSLVVSGHDHNYERGRHGALNYIVTGGGGAELRPLRCGVPGKRRCKNPPLAFANEHNYVRLDVLPGALQLCPRRADRTPLEDCTTIRLPR
jgi:hypothetical protein